MRKDVGLAAVAGASSEIVAELIAGPETAARLGVPVGTVVDARHVITAKDGTQLQEDDVVTPEAAARARRRILGQTEKE